MLKVQRVFILFFSSSICMRNKNNFQEYLLGLLFLLEKKKISSCHSKRSSSKQPLSYPRAFVFHLFTFIPSIHEKVAIKNKFINVNFRLLFFAKKIRVCVIYVCIYKTRKPSSLTTVQLNDKHNRFH